jgi:hypothetical protein
MAGRDLSAELFPTPAPSQQGRDLSADLFAEPSATDEILNVGRRGLLQAEGTREALKFQSGAIDAKTYAERISALDRQQKQIKPSGDVAAGLERLQEANETGSYSDVAKEIIKPKNWKALASLIGESAVATVQTVPIIVGAGIAAGPPGLAVASGVTSFATEFGSAIGELLDKKKVDTSNVAAVQKLLEDPKFISEAREYGLKRGIPVAAFDALSAGFAGRFVKALKSAGTGITRKVAIKAGAKEAGVQVGSGMAGEAGGQILTGENKPLDVFVEGMADLPGGVAEVATGARNRKDKGTKGKDLSSELFGEKEAAPPPPPAKQATATTPEQVRAERIAARTETNIQQGIPVENAEPIATRKVDAELKAENKAAAIKVPESRAEQITQDLIAAGVDPQQAMIDAQKLAQEEAEADANAEKETQGAANAGQPIPEPSGASTSVVGRPDTDVPTGGIGGAQPNGVVSAPKNVGLPVNRKATQPTPLTPEQIAKRDELFNKENIFMDEEPKEITKEPAPPAPLITDEEKDKGISNTVAYFEKRDELLKQLDAASEEGSALTDKLSELDSIRAAGVLGVDGKPLVLDENGKYDPNKKYEAVKTLETELNKSTAKFDAVIKQIDELDAARKTSKVNITSEEAYAERTKGDPTAPPFNDTDARIKRVADLYEQMGDKDFAKVVRDIPNQGRPSYEETAKLEAVLEVDQNQHQKDKDFAEKKSKVESIARANASTAFDRVNDYPNLQEALDSYEANMADTLVEEGFKNGPDYDNLLTAASRAFDAEVNRQKGITSGTETPKAVKATQEGQTAPTAPAVAKGKTGPKPKSAEVKAQIKVSRNEQTRINNDAEYNRKKFVAQLDQILTPEQIEELSFEEAEQAEIDARQSRRSALRGLVELQGNPNIARGSAVGKRISADIKNSKATEAELTDIRRGIKAAEDVLTGPKENVLGAVPAPGVSGKTEAKANKSADVKVDKPDVGFNKAANGVQAITHIMNTGTAFQKFIAGRIRSYVVGVKFVVVEEGDATPANILAEMEGARGLFVYTPGSKDRTIYVRGSSFGDAQGINNITVLHELLHAATANRITAGLMKGFRNAQLQKFMREMSGIMKRAESAYRLGVERGTISSELQDLIEAGSENIEFDANGNPKFQIFNDHNEFLAYGMSNPEFQKFLMRVKGMRTEPTLFSTFVNNIRDLFGLQKGDATAFSDLVDITDKMLDTRVTPFEIGAISLQQKGKKTPPKEVKLTPPEFNEEADIKAQRSALQLAKDARIAKEKVRLSREGEETKNVELMQLARDPKAVRQILANVTSDLGYAKLEATVRLPTFDFLSKWAADAGIPALEKANTQLQRMLGMSQQFLVGAEQMIGSLNRGFKEDPKLSRSKFSEFVYATTLAEIDPSDTNTRVRSRELDADYKALGPVGQRLYKQLRDYYEAIIELYSDLLDEQINNLQGMTPEEKKNLMLVLRKTFEAESRIRPFFPLVRRGDFFLAIGSGEQRLFYLFKTRGERNAKAKELVEGRGEDYEDVLFRQEFVQGNDLRELRAASQDASTMIKEVFAAIDAKDMGSPEAKESLKDAVYQIYLTTMPEQSFRRQFTHRKGRGGFSTDLQQNIATTASKQSIQLARLKYAPLLRNSMAEARSSIREREELSPFVQEAEKRIDMALSGVHGSLSESIAGIANKASYFWYLSSAASALIQPSSVFISGLPVLGGNYNNVTGAAKELAKMAVLVNQYSVFRTNSDGTTSITAPSIANNKSLPKDEQKAIGEMTSRGVSESTYASLVWGYKSMSTEQFEGVVGKGKRLANLMVGALMHNTERLSREAVYLAAYRLGKKQGLDYDTAVQKAVDSTNEALGNYDVTNRPRFMQQGIGKVAFQFKTYPLQMTLLLLTNFKNMLPFLNKEGKKEAATKFFGTMGTSFLLAGAANMALINPIMGLAGWAWSQLSLDDDWPEELKNIDFFTWFFEVLLPEKLGDVTLGGVPVSDLIKEGPLNALTGWAVGSRIGLADIWGRDSKETKTSRESAIAFGLDHFGGPTASMGLGFADAYDAYAMGDYQKMLERMLPAVARNLVIANKYADEGIKTGRGVELVGKDDVKTGELIGQAIGFRPDILAATQGPAFKLSGIDQKINNQRSLILNKLDFQRRKDTDEGDKKFDDIIDNEVSKFNDKYPSYRLNRDTINESLKKKKEQRLTSRAGVNVTKQNKPIIEEATDTLENRLDRRAEEMAAKRKAEKNPQ